MALKILFPDNLHINERNFPSLHNYMKKNNVTVHFESERSNWWACYGNYTDKKSLRDRAKVLNEISDIDRLLEFEIRGINLFRVARAETLSIVIVQPEWYENDVPTDPFEVFKKLHTLNRHTLMYNLAAAWDWVDYWSNRLVSLPSFTHCCIFSGSLIYQRTLLELLKQTSTKTFLMESFFTGNDYYFEEKYEPISNKCDIRHKSVVSSIEFDGDNEFDKERVKALNKILLSSNKNVKQPETGGEIVFENPDATTVLLLGQVVNDFSLLECEFGISSVSFYKNAINALTSAGINVIFKSHPWEEHKHNVRRKFTKGIIEEYSLTLSREQRRHIRIVDHYPIDWLFQIVDYVAGINSQGLMEAAFQGFKPAQFGCAFFGNSGFTYDFKIDNVSLFIEKVKSDKFGGKLSLVEYRDFEVFMTKLLQKQLVSVHPSGVSRIAAKLAPIASIALVAPNNNKALSANPAPKKAPLNIPLKKEPVKQASEAPVSTPSEIMSSEPVDKLGDLQKKFSKFRNNPHAFFGDSKFTVIRPLRHLF